MYKNAKPKQFLDYILKIKAWISWGFTKQYFVLFNFGSMVNTVTFEGKYISMTTVSNDYYPSITPTFEAQAHCTLGWSDFSCLWNFEKKKVGVVTFVKKNMFS